jgi:accessory colonization factor AcfC
MKTIFKKLWLYVALISFTLYGKSFADINLYGPGGPHAAFIEASELFTKETQIKVNIKFGPDANWRDEAAKKASFIWGTSEQSAQAVLEGLERFNYAQKSIPLYYRDSVIFVKKDNPKKIKGIKNLFKRKDLKILVIGASSKVNTSGVGAWEDVIGRGGSIDDLRSIKSNIKTYAFNSGQARASLTDKESEIDAVIAFEDWTLTLGDAVNKIDIEKEYRISRSINITPQNNLTTEEERFLKFLLTNPEVDKIFHKYSFYKNRKDKKSKKS